MLALSRIDTGDSRDLLRQVLQGRMAPADAAPEDRINAGGRVVFRGDDPDEDRPASDAVFAAVLLGDLGDRQSLAAAEALLERTEGEDRAMLEEAVAKLR